MPMVRFRFELMVPPPAPHGCDLRLRLQVVERNRNTPRVEGDISPRRCAPSPALAGEGWGGGASQVTDAAWREFPPPAALRRAIALPSASTSPASGRGAAASATRKN